MQIEIRFLSYWRAGTGRGSAGSLDALCLRDDLGLPVLPGKHLRGLIRDAVRMAHELGKTRYSAEDLFGTRVAPETEGQATETRKGILRVSNAHLPADDLGALLGQESELAPFLFDIRRSTAMERDRGVAKPRSLRAEEVALPITLVAQITAHEHAGEEWEEAVRVALPLVRAAGSGRTRGLGRCIVTASGDGSDA